jgi:hypothetical protein
MVVIEAAPGKNSVTWILAELWGQQNDDSGEIHV